MNNQFLRISLYVGILLYQSCSFNHFFYNTKNETCPIDKNPKFEELLLTNASGDILNGLLLNPNDNNVKGNILLIHGNSDDISRWIENAKPLFDHNYRVLIFDYEGYGKSMGKPTHKNVVSDTELFLNYLNQRFGKVILWGISLGGNLSVNIAYRNSDKVKGLIIEGGFTSHNEIARKLAPGAVRPFILMTVRSPYKSKEIIKKLHIPVLVAHSPADQVVPYRMGRTLFENANEPKFFLELSGKHCDGIRNNTREYLELIDKINSVR